MKQSIPGYFAQLLLIVFSVVLGIFLSERIEEQKSKKEASLLLSKIKSEVNENKKLIEYWEPYHREMSISLDSLSNNETFIKGFIDDKATLFEQVLKRGTFMGRMPSNDAWDIAKSHPLIVYFDYDELLILSKIYNQQEMTFEPVSKIAELFFSADLNAKEKARTNLQEFNTLMREIVSREGQLISYFKEAEKTLKLQDH